jgi:hypothetical protein
MRLEEHAEQTERQDMNTVDETLNETCHTGNLGTMGMILKSKNGKAVPVLK